jgi:hypothetical protein
MMMLTSPEDIQRYRLLVIAKGLSLEINTGMRCKNNAAFNAAKKITGCKTREKCLIALNEIIDNPPA